jgi:membrane protein
MAAARSLVRLWLERLVAVQVADRAVALAALAFTVLIPLFIVYDAVVPAIDGRDFATGLVDRFELRGDAAASLRHALAPPEAVKQTVGVLGLVLVVASALSFARALQRMYEQAFRLPPIGGLRGTPATLLWLALIPAYVVVRDVIGALVHGGLAAVLSIALAALVWTVTPFVLLGRRLSNRELLPTGIVTAAAMAALSAGTVLWMTRAVTDSANRYGLVGVAFAFLTWLVAAGFALVASAAAGAVWTERLGDRQRGD